MRIIAGKYKRNPLKTLDGEDITRPTRDMVKEALFSTIFIDEETRFLDLFAGSGAIGLEALSRGAKDAVFNDINKDAYRIICANLDKVHENRKVYQMDYKKCLNTIKGEEFDYIYLDPPYAFHEYERLFSLIEENDVLKQDGIIIVEVHKDTVLDENYGKMLQYKVKNYGINKLLYYRRSGGSQS